MKMRSLTFFRKDLSITTGVALTVLLIALPFPSLALSLITNRTALKGNDRVDWSSLANPSLPFTFDE
jgi:hypothetical protein